ncbi:MAG: BON domain-containing protein [Myxococcales bacterium]|nr:BON domain-containing protein [Myxococcales bacterium]
MGDRYDERYRRGSQREFDRDRRYGSEAGGYGEHDDDRRYERPYEERWQQAQSREWPSGSGPYDQGRYEAGRSHEPARPWEGSRPYESGRPYESRRPFESGRAYESRFSEPQWRGGQWRGEGGQGQRGERFWQGREPAWRGDNPWQGRNESTWRQDMQGERPQEFGFATVEIYDEYGPAQRRDDRREHHDDRREHHHEHGVGAAFEHLKENVKKAFRGLKGYKRTDDRIREDVCDRINTLSMRMGIDVSDVEVQVKDAEVTLTGTMPNRRHKHLIENEAEMVGGVKDVQNQVRVRSEQQEAHTAAAQSLTSGASVPIENGGRGGVRTSSTGGNLNQK